MDALLTSFIAAGLAEWGDKTQLLVVALAARYRQPGPILAGILVAALANALIAAFGGTLVHGMIIPRATALLVGVALLFAGVAGLIRGKVRPEVASRRGAFLTALGAFFVLEFGDKTQFVTFGIAAHYDALVLAAAGATAGVLAASIPAALLGDRLNEALPLKGMRIGIALLFLVAGFVVAVNALALV
ncbi:MAG: TMEM165/GDT1 family protein [Allosphingosinicella sp.]